MVIIIIIISIRWIYIFILFTIYSLCFFLLTHEKKVFICGGSGGDCGVICVVVDDCFLCVNYMV